MITVGVTGYCPPSVFDETRARFLISEAYDFIATQSPASPITVVSGLINAGVPGLAYAEATRRRWRTVGVVCLRRYRKYADQRFPVRKTIIVAEEEQESTCFLRDLDVLICVGSGEQSRRELAAAHTNGTLTIVCDLPRL